MAFLTDVAKDALLQSIFDDTNRLYLCSAEPTTFAEASSTYRLGFKDTPPMSGPADGAVDGRHIQITAFSDGTVEITGTATHYALVDEAGGVLLAVGSLVAPIGVTALDTFTVQAGSEISITVRDPA